jgi:hypothetical protein
MPTERLRERKSRRGGQSGLADQSIAIDSDPAARWVPLAQANVGAVERRALHFVPTIVALRQEQAWAGGKLSQVDLFRFSFCVSNSHFGCPPSGHESENCLVAS